MTRRSAAAAAAAGDGGVVFTVTGVAWEVVEDQAYPEGHLVLCATYVRADELVPQDVTEHEWSTACEVREWCSRYVTPAAQSKKARKQTPAAAVRQSERLRASGALPLVAGAASSRAAALLEGDDADDAGAADGGQHVVGGGGAGHGSAVIVELGPDRLGYAFSRIVRCVKSTAYGARYQVEYKVGNRVETLNHTRQQLSDRAVREFEERLRKPPFAYSAEEQLQRESMCSGTDKEKQATLKSRLHTCGICCAVTNCGIVVDVYELFGSEGCAQVYLSWLDFYDLVPELQRIILIHLYDNACHLLSFATKRRSLSARAESFMQTKMVCDELHYPNHANTGESTWARWCRDNCNPAQPSTKFTRGGRCCALRG